MMRMLSLALIFLSLGAQAVQLDTVQREVRYLSFLNAIKNGDAKSFFSPDAIEQKLMVDALWDAQEEGLKIAPFLEQLEAETLGLAEQLRLAVIAHRAGRGGEVTALTGAVLAAMGQDPLLATLVVSLQYDLQAMGLDHLVQTARALFPEPTHWVAASERPVGDQSAQAKALWDYEADLSRYAGGAYEKGVRLYMFCRTNRLYACLMVVRDAHFAPVLNDAGELWTHPALASSARGLPSYQRNGNTPAGIHRIDGVMPEADQQISYGKFRRLILDFIPKGSNESHSKLLLPPSAHGDDWWKPASVARDVGRDLFRVHGTGKPNTEPTSSWFPFMRTSGCVAQRENEYNGIEYRDQELLLNVLMKAQGLDVRYANHTAIKGLLYLIEIDDEARAVTAADIKKIGIE